MGPFLRLAYHIIHNVSIPEQEGGCHPQTSRLILDASVTRVLSFGLGDGLASAGINLSGLVPGLPSILTPAAGVNADIHVNLTSDLISSPPWDAAMLSVIPGTRAWIEIGLFDPVIPGATRLLNIAPGLPR